MTTKLQRFSRNRNLTKGSIARARGLLASLNHRGTLTAIQRHDISFVVRQLDRMLEYWDGHNYSAKKEHGLA